MILWEGLLGPSLGIPWQNAQQNAQQQDRALWNALIAQQNYAPMQAALERQAWRASVSQNWLNAMIDVELGV